MSISRWMIYSHNTDFYLIKFPFKIHSTFYNMHSMPHATCHTIASILLSSKTMLIIIVILAKSQLSQIGSQLTIHTIPIFNWLSNAPFLGNPLLGQEMITRMGDIDRTPQAANSILCRSPHNARHS